MVDKPSRVFDREDERAGLVSYASDPNPAHCWTSSADGAGRARVTCWRLWPPQPGVKVQDAHVTAKSYGESISITQRQPAAQ
jgi:hypothetical protein